MVGKIAVFGQWGKGFSKEQKKEKKKRETGIVEEDCEMRSNRASVCSTKSEALTNSHFPAAKNGIGGSSAMCLDLCFCPFTATWPGEIHGIL